MKPLNENSSITYNNVKNITYQGTQAQGGTFIYNNVENIQKEAVELHNSYNSSSSSMGISAGATIGYGNKIQTTGNGVSISAGRSNQNTVETIHANGNFNNVNEVHNNTKNMTLRGFNQEGGKVTGTIENLEVISLQNTSTTTGSSSGISVGISASGIPNFIGLNYSSTNGERGFVDNQSSFIVGEGSNLAVGKATNTGAVIGKQGENSNLKIDEYIGQDLNNYDTMRTTGVSVGLQTGNVPVSNIGYSQDSRDKEGISRNTVIGNVEIGTSTGATINTDLSKANEVTKDVSKTTNINVESQTIEYAVNPDKLKEDIGKAKQEISDVTRAFKESVNDRGDDNRNFFGQLSEVRLSETIENIVGEKWKNSTSDLEISEAYRMALKDLGYDNVQIIFSDPKNSPQLLDEKGNPKAGTAFVDKKGVRTIIINAEAPENSTRSGLIGTLSEEGSHVIGKVEGRQIETETDEKGLESTGRATNEYFQDKYKDDDTAISIQSDGKDYSNIDFGEHVGDICNKAVNGCVKGHLSQFLTDASPQQYVQRIAQKIEDNMGDIAHDTKKYQEIINRKGKKKALEAMELEGFGNMNYKWLGPFGKKLFALYGASDEIRKEYLVSIKKTGEDDFYSKRPWNKKKLIMDDYMPDEMYRLFNRKESTSLMNKIANKWADSIKGKNTSERKYEDRLKEHKIVDFTLSNTEFTALGHTNLFTSSYGKIKKINGGYNVNITVLIQYRDTFDDVGNIWASGSQKNPRQELKGGNPFGIETRKKEIKINKTLKSLNEIENEVKRALSQRK